MPVKQLLYKSLWWRCLYYLSVFFVNILIARHYESAISGSIYYVSSIYTLVLLVLSGSIESGITFFSAQQKISPGKLLGFSVVWSLLSGAIAWVFFLYYVPALSSLITKPLLLLAAFWFICGNLLTSFATGLFYASKDFVLPNVVGILSNTVVIASLPFNGQSIIPGVTDSNYLYLYFALFLINGIVLTIAAQLKYVKNKLPGFLSKPELRLLFRYCAMAYLANVIFFLIYRIDFWFVERYCTKELLGNYIQVSKIGQLFFILPTILASVVFPLTAGGQRENINRLLPLLSRSILLLYFIACFVLSVIGYWLFPFVFGSSFINMYQPFLLLIPGILSLSGLFTLTAYYAGKDRIIVNMKGSLLALVVIIIGDSIFIPVYGIHAAALVSSIGYIVYGIYVLFIFKKEYQVNNGDFIFYKKGDLAEMKKLIRPTEIF